MYSEIIEKINISNFETTQKNRLNVSQLQLNVKKIFNNLLFFILKNIY